MLNIGVVIHPDFEVMIKGEPSQPFGGGGGVVVVADEDGE